MTRAQQAEGEILALKQRARLVVDYVQEFHWITGKLRLWQEWLLVHHFKAGLDHKLCQACAYRGLPPTINEWLSGGYRVGCGITGMPPGGGGGS